MPARPKRIGAHDMDIVTIIAQPIFETDVVLKGGTACSEVSQEETPLGDILVEGLDEPGETFLHLQEHGKTNHCYQPFQIITNNDATNNKNQC